MPYTHFTLEERKYLQKLLSEGESFRSIARILERSPSSISREVKRNSAVYPPKKKPDNKYWYNHWRAQSLYIRRRRTHLPHAILPGTAKWEFVLDGFNAHWSPEAIAGRWKTLYPEEKSLCVSTIYRYVKDGRFPKVTVKDNLRRRGRRQCKAVTNYNTIHPDRIIPQWPEEIKNRERLGDFEGDTFYGGVGKGLLVTLVDRKSRFLFTEKIHSRNARETREAIERMLGKVNVKSISLDNGSEFSKFRLLEKSLGAPVYFAEPHKPWQRGTNENTNGLLRFFFPKGYDFHSLSEDYLQQVTALINSRPRKCLGWRTPAEVFFADEGVALG